MRRSFAVVFIATVLATGLGSMPVAALAQDADEAFTADETAGDIDRIRTSLYVIAAVTGGLLVVYIWHTNPRRRMDVAVRRRAAREQDQIDSLGDAFVLPGDVAGGADPVDHGQSTDA